MPGKNALQSKKYFLFFPCARYTRPRARARKGTLLVNSHRVLKMKVMLKMNLWIQLTGGLSQRDGEGARSFKNSRKGKTGGTLLRVLRH